MGSCLSGKTTKTQTNRLVLLGLHGDLTLFLFNSVAALYRVVCKDGRGPLKSGANCDVDVEQNNGIGRGEGEGSCED